jgi:hypothetical protein
MTVDIRIIILTGGLALAMRGKAAWRNRKVQS